MCVFKEFDRRSTNKLPFLLVVYPHYCCQTAYQLNWASSGPLNKLLALFKEGNQIMKLAHTQHSTTACNTMSNSSLLCQEFRDHIWTLTYSIWISQPCQICVYISVSVISSLV